MTGIADRLAAVSRRFTLLASGSLPAGLTDADPKTGEQWDAGQVWAHTAEFPAYWLEQLAIVVGGWRGEPVPFGRVKTDPDRVAAIEVGRYTDLPTLHSRVQDGISAALDKLAALPEAAWQAQGVHSTLGVMDVGRIVEEFLVGHLEEHADQLEGLTGS